MTDKIFPAWIKVRAPVSNEFLEIQKIAKNLCLETVCQSASCPNIAECWKNHHATFMIMGNICTRKCRFCNIPCGKPSQLDKDEPRKVALAVKQLGLKHAVITCVTRDDLPDQGAQHFAKTINEIHKICPETTIEVLTSDFINQPEALNIVISAKPDVFNYNIETVRRLHKQIKIGSDYDHGLRLLKKVKEIDNQIFTKSGIIVGMGETDQEIFETMNDLRRSDVDFLTIGQYLKPKDMDKRYIDVDRFVDPEQFDKYKTVGLEKGFLLVASSPFTRSSYHADNNFRELKTKRRIN